MLIEHNVVHKNPCKVDVRFASCYPNHYKTAMSSLGYHIIYDFLNSREDVYCERVVYPYPKSLESNTPLNRFDFIGFSLQYEQDYFNVLSMLNKGNIPIRCVDRTSKDPLVIAGGPCATANPLPVSNFIDLFIVGEAEVILDEVLDLYMELDNPRKDIEAFLDIKGVYVADNPAIRCIVKDMDNACHPTRQVVLETSDKRFLPAFGRAFLLGISRGCSRGCRFCMSGYLYRPRRETSLKKLLKIAEKGRRATGLNKIALIGAAVSDYTKIDELGENLLERDFQLTTPSLRTETVTEKLIDSLNESGLKTITLAPESTFSIRKCLNKDFDDNKLFDISKIAFERDMNIKYYFLIGTPGESTKDLREMLGLIKNLRKLAPKKNMVKLSINPLIPKPHTPFQWELFNYEDVKSKISYINKYLGYKSFKIENLKGAFIQYILSMGDRNLGDLIEKSWQSRINIKEWEKYGKTINYDLKSRLPWENIDIGVKKEFIINEYKKMKRGKVTSWCEEYGCYKCGSCI
ncbi:MAG: radical SAM protein [Methanobacteriaceae archaeon]|nr:radical SAM protein [Methanobacteriaceae archaeon]